jgi:alpha-tubulin suppressor-like RCC1 family protein
LVATVSPSMSGTVVPGTTQIPHGEWVTLVATAGFGYVFDHWEGDAEGTTRSIEVLMDRPRTIRAVFVVDPYIQPGAIACSATWATVINSDGTLWAVGRNGNGQQGHLRNGDPGEFWPVALASGVRQAGIGEDGGIAITTQGKIVGWGGYWGSVDCQMQAHQVYTTLSGDIRGLSGMRTHYFFDRYGALFDGLNRPVEIGFNGEGLDDVVALGEGPDTVFAVTRDGKLYGWGNNTFGQLGLDIALASHEHPQLVEGIEGVRQVACGQSDLTAFTLALLDDGTVWSWGDSSVGQLGRTGTADSPAPIPGLSRIIKIVAGDRYGMALDQDGNLWAWGDNTFGQFGTGDYDDLAEPQVVASGIADVGAGPVYALVRQDDNDFAWCGQVPGATDPVDTWTVIPGLAYGDASVTLDVTSDPAGLTNFYPPTGQHRIAPNRPIPLHAEDTTRYAFAYWSEGVDDRLAADTTLTTSTTSSVSVRFRFQDDAMAMLTVGAGTGGSTTPETGEWEYTPGTVVTLRADPAVGYRFHSWEGDVSDTKNRTTTILMDRDQTVLARFVASPLDLPPQIATGRENNMGYDSLILHSDTRVQDYGAEASGSFVRLTTSANLDNVIAVAVGAQHQLALSRDGTVWSWDANQYGQCGTGETTESYTFPQKVRDAEGVLQRVARIAAGTHFSLALTNEGALYSWGRNQSGQLGHSDGEELVNEARLALTGVRAMACGGQFALAVTSDGTVLAWGANESGQMGTAPGRSAEPTAVAGLPVIVDVAAGGTCAAALSASGEVWTWGGNGYGQLGQGTTGDWALPAKVAGLPVVVAVAVGPEHMLALDANGSVWAWGRGDQGALGNGGTSDSSVPVQVLDSTTDQPLADIQSIDCHVVSYAIDDSGNLYQWGYDNSMFNDGSGIVSRPTYRGNYGAADLQQELCSLDLVVYPPDAGSISPQEGVLYVNRGARCRGVPLCGLDWWRLREPAEHHREGAEQSACSRLLRACGAHPAAGTGVADSWCHDPARSVPGGRHGFA